MSDELKPCPFCGVESKLVGGRIYSNHSSFCILNAILVYDFQRTSWNSRPLESALEAKLKVAVEALEEVQSNGRVGMIAMEALDKIKEMK